MSSTYYIHFSMPFLIIDFIHAPLWLHLVFALFIGACVGSFLNVVIYRIAVGPLMREQGQHFNISYPPSHCPLCNHRLSWYENVPILAWFIQLGRCRACHVSISYQYPLVEVLFSLGTVVLMWMVGPTLLWLGLVFAFMGIVPIVWWSTHHNPWHIYMHGWYITLFGLALICGVFYVSV